MGDDQTRLVVGLVAFDRYVDREITHPVAATGADEASEGTCAGSSPSLPGRVRRELRQLLSSPPILALTVLWFLTSAAGWGIKQYTVALLSAGYAVPDATANFAVSAMLVTGAVRIFAGGWLTDRYSPGPVLVGGYAALVVVAALAVVAIGLTAVVLRLGRGGTTQSSHPVD